MNRRIAIAILVFAGLSLAPVCSHVIADEQPLLGYSAESSRVERQWEEKMRAIPSPENLRAYMQRLAAHPHNVGTTYDKENAEWIAAKFKEFGLDTQIEQFDVLFPTAARARRRVARRRSEVRGQAAGAGDPARSHIDAAVRAASDL